MSVTYTITTSTGFPITLPPGSPQSGDIVPENLLPGVYGGVPISFDLKISSTEPEFINYISATNELSSIGVDIQILSTSTDTVSISANFTGIFNETFKFLKRDLTEAILPPNNTEDWLTLIQWVPPSISLTTVYYTFTYVVNVSETVSYISSSTFVQEVYYGYQQSLNTFRNLLSQGEI
jgi:hypothetical protein